jgi:hypothetical protein
MKPSIIENRSNGGNGLRDRCQVEKMAFLDYKLAQFHWPRNADQHPIHNYPLLRSRMTKPGRSP